MNHRDKSKEELLKEIERLEDEKNSYLTLEKQLRRTEDALFKSNSMFQLVIDNIPQYIFWKDKESNYLGCNKIFAVGAGLASPEEIVGKNDYDLAWTKEEADFYREVDKHVMINNMPEYNIVESQKQSDGKIALINTNKIPLTDEKGNVIGILGTFEDITEKKKAEDLLRESQQKYKTLVEHSLVGIYITQNHIIKFLNKKLAELFGYDNPDELLGKHIKDIVDLKSWVLIDQEVNQRQRGEKTESRYDFIGIRKDRKKVYMEALGVNVEIDGKMAEQGTIIDISDRVRAQRDLKILNEELEQIVIDRTSQLQEALEEYRYENYERKRTQDELYLAKEKLEEMLVKERELNGMKSRFISMVSHEYRTPLTAIHSSTYIIEQYLKHNKQDEVAKQTEKIRRSIQDMTRLLEDVLTIGKAESGKMAVEITKLNLIEVCNDVLEESKVVDKNDHKFSLMSDSRFLMMMTDRTHIYHILSNLVSNAAKYSPNNSEVKLIVMDEVENVTIKVVDHGIGIPTDEADKVFEPFLRFDNVGNVPGTGLGLAIVKKCVDNLNGEITFTSKLNEGTTFKVIMPKNSSKPWR